MKFVVHIFIALFLCQTLAHPAEAITSTAFYKRNTPVAQVGPWLPTIESIANPIENINPSALEVHRHPKR